MSSEPLFMAPSALRAVLRPVALAALVAAVAACNTGDESEDLPSSVAGPRITAGFVAAQDPNCPRADLLSMQPSTASGSFVVVDVTLTDCDGSLRSSGLGFEISFDSSVLSFVNCAAGSFFPTNQLAPQTPECVVSGGRVLGTIGLTPPNSVVMGGSGRRDLVEIAFSVRQNGVSTPLAFESTDLDSGTSLWFIDNTPTVTFYTLGGAGYAGGTLVAN